MIHVPTVVLDASAMLELLLNTDRAPLVAERLFNAPDRVGHVPHLLDLEVAQVLRRLVRRKTLDEMRAGEALTDLADLPLMRHAHHDLLPLVWSMRANVTAYDAAYLALASQLDARLLTSDAALATVPGFGDQVDLLAD